MRWFHVMKISATLMEGVSSVSEAVTGQRRLILLRREEEERLAREGVMMTSCSQRRKGNEALYRRIISVRP